MFSVSYQKLKIAKWIPITCVQALQEWKEHVKKLILTLKPCLPCLSVTCDVTPVLWLKGFKQGWRSAFRRKHVAWSPGVRRGKISWSCWARGILGWPRSSSYVHVQSTIQEVCELQEAGFVWNSESAAHIGGSSSAARSRLGLTAYVFEQATFGYPCPLLYTYFQHNLVSCVILGELATRFCLFLFWDWSGGACVRTAGGRRIC